MKPFVLGITGGIASGKSVVSETLAAAGAFVIDADVVSREVVADGTEGDALLRAAFPFAYTGGSLDRSKLRERVFADPEERERLDSITHPLIRREIERKIAACSRHVAVVVVPLMFEAGFDSLCDRVVAVSADPETRINRLVARNNITVELARAMVNSQAGEDERNRAADEVIFNDGSVVALKEKAKQLYERVISMTGSGTRAR